MAGQFFATHGDSNLPHQAPPPRRPSHVSPIPEPPLLHTPPQIFGAYAPDGSPIPPNFSDPIFTIDQMGFMPDDGMSDAKRRRIARVRNHVIMLDESCY